MNVKKTKTMIISKEPAEKSFSIKVNDTILEQVDIFKYLGTLIMDNLRTEKEIQTRLNLAKAIFFQCTKSSRPKDSKCPQD